MKLTMEWTWLTFLVSLACLVFGMTCSVLFETGQTLTSNWCPSEVGNAGALIALGVGGVVPSLIVLNEEKEDKTNFQGYFKQFRTCSMVLLWLSAGGKLWVLFASLGVESVADLLLARISVLHELVSSPLVYTILVKVLTIACLAAAGNSQASLFLCSVFFLRILSKQGQPPETSLRSLLLQFIAPWFSSALISSAISSETALFFLIVFEILTVPIYFSSVQVSNIVTPSYESVSVFTMPTHRAAVVVGGVALVSTAYTGLNPAVLSAYIYAQSSRDLAKLGVMFAFGPFVDIWGPAIMDAIHKETGSLLKTGLIAFWFSALAIMPIVMVLTIYKTKSNNDDDENNAWYSLHVKEGIIMGTSLLWRGAFAALASVENRIVSEWSVAQDSVAEQRAMCAIAILVSSLANVTLAAAIPVSAAVTISILFALVCCFLGATCYTIWFAKNDRGPWRLVDGEGRELLRVTG